MYVSRKRDLKARGLGHTGVTLNLFYFPRRTIGIPRNPTGFLLFGPIPSAQSLQLSPSQHTDCSPITSPDVVEPHVSLGSGPPAENLNTNLLKTPLGYVTLPPNSFSGT